MCTLALFPLELRSYFPWESMYTPFGKHTLCTNWVSLCWLNYSREKINLCQVPLGEGELVPCFPWELEVHFLKSHPKKLQCLRILIRLSMNRKMCLRLCIFKSSTFFLFLHVEDFKVLKVIVKFFIHYATILELFIKKVTFSKCCEIFHDGWFFWKISQGMKS
jgi:hypothetical protein